MTYDELVARLQAHAAELMSEDAEFAIAMPGMIQAGELRCLRDCDFPSARKTQSLAIGAGVVAIAPPPDLVVPRAAWLVTGAGETVRSEVQRRDASFLREYWPDTSVTGVPKYFATTDETSILICPPPAVPTRLDMEYTFRPAGLSPSNPETWLSLRYPDLLFFAVMVLVTGYQKNFGQQAEDPRMSASWAGLYDQALAVARNEAATGKGWGASDPTPTPPPSTIAPAGQR